MIDIYSPVGKKGVQKKGLERIAKVFLTSSRYYIPNKLFENDTKIGFKDDGSAGFIISY